MKLSTKRLVPLVGILCCALCINGCAFVGVIIEAIAGIAGGAAGGAVAEGVGGAAGSQMGGLVGGAVQGVVLDKGTELLNERTNGTTPSRTGSSENTVVTGDDEDD